MEGDEFVNNGRITLVCREKGCGQQCEVSINVDLAEREYKLGTKIKLRCISPVIPFVDYVEASEFEVVHAWTWES